MMYPCFRCRYMKLMRFSNINNAKIQQVLPRPPPPPSICSVFGTNIDIVHWMWSKLNLCKHLPTQSSASDRPAVFRAPFMFVTSRLIIHLNFLNKYYTIYISIQPCHFLAEHHSEILLFPFIHSLKGYWLDILDIIDRYLTMLSHFTISNENREQCRAIISNSKIN